MNCARINTSHGDFNQYTEIINNVRSVCNVPIVLDTQGPGVRTVNDFIEFTAGQVISFGLSINIFNKLKKGIIVLLNDGLDVGTIVDIKEGLVFVKMKTNGSLKNKRSIIFKNVSLNLPCLTEKDEQSLKFAVKNNVEFVAISYTRNKNDVLLVQDKLKNSGIKLIVKIENNEGVKNFDEILSICDAVMVARGDLGVELDLETVPIIQKNIIKKCNKVGKPVIVATQMMESMITNKTPTRAETSDVANAIMDGADCVMLSGETSIGSNPELVIKTMTKICKNTEKFWIPESFNIDETDSQNVVTCNAASIAKTMNAQVICLTRSGFSARMINRFRPNNNVIAITPDELVSKQLMISYGVMPVFYPNVKEFNTKEVDDITKHCIKLGLLKREDTVVFVAGLFIKKTTNAIVVYEVKELLK